MNGLLVKHASFKKVRKYHLKLKIKPWITAAIHKAILVKNDRFKKYFKLKDSVRKTERHDKSKYCINLNSTVIKKSKRNYNFNNYKIFKNNMNNIRNTWKGTRNWISWKRSGSSFVTRQ